MLARRVLGPEASSPEACSREECSGEAPLREQASGELRRNVGPDSAYFVPDLSPILILNTEINLFYISSILW